MPADTGCCFACAGQWHPVFGPVNGAARNSSVACQQARLTGFDRIGATGGVIHVAPFTAYLVNFSTPEKLEAIRKARSAAGLPETYSYPYELYWELPDPAARETFTTSIRESLGPATIDTMIDHIDYIVKRIGIDHVGIGTDFNHGSGIEGYDDASASFAVTLGLLRRGYSAEDIKKIWGGNFIRVWREAEAITEANAQ